MVYQKRKSSEFVNETLSCTELALQHTLIIIQSISPSFFKLREIGWKRIHREKKNIPSMSEVEQLSQ